MIAIKKTKVILLVVIAIVAITLVSYSVALDMMLKNDIVIHKDAVEESNNLTRSDVFSGDVEVKLNVVPLNKISTIKNYKNSELSGLIKKDLTLSNVDGYFYNNGYTLESSNKDKIVFIKTTKYIPEKYYLGVDNGYIAVFKCDGSGDLVVENQNDDISPKTIEQMPVSDRDFIKNNDYEFDSKNDALDELASLSS